MMKTFGYFGLIAIFLLGCQSGSNILNKDEKITVYTNKGENGKTLKINVQKGKEHNHPSFAIWTEDVDGNYIETLYITQSVGTGIFKYGNAERKNWQPGEKQYPASLPYWGHKRGVVSLEGNYIPDPSSKTADAITGATPPGSFGLVTILKETKINEFKLLFEVNQTWDFNEYWTNNKFPDNAAYKSSCQPALIYAVTINVNDTISNYTLNAIGHSHYAGEDGELYEDLSTMTTALDIFESIGIKLQD